MHLWTNLRGIRAFHLVATKVSSVFSVEGGIFLALCKIVTVSNPRPGEPRGAQEFMSSPYTLIQLQIRAEMSEFRFQYPSDAISVSSLEEYSVCLEMFFLFYYLLTLIRFRI